MPHVHIVITQNRKMPSDNIYYSRDGVDLITMCKSVHASMNDNEVRLGKAAPRGTGIFLICRSNQEYASAIYFDYFQNKIVGLKLNAGTWSEV